LNFCQRHFLPLLKWSCYFCSWFHFEPSSCLWNETNLTTLYTIF
jgi:hypothetical protein